MGAAEYLIDTVLLAVVLLGIACSSCHALEADVLCLAIIANRSRYVAASMERSVIDIASV